MRIFQVPNNRNAPELSAEWYESAIFVEQDNEWRIDDEAAYWLDVKYMACERIVEVVHRKGGGLQ